jgi:hypothetical protein
MLTFRKSGNNTNKPVSPEAPEINAGPDHEVKLPASSLKIVASVEGESESYGWTQVGGNKVNLSGSTSRTANISGLKEGVYKFRFTVKYLDEDKERKEKYDDVLVTVKASGNHAPVVSAGSDKTLTLPEDHVLLQGKATDQDKDPLRYQWKQKAGGGVTMNGAQTANLDIANLKAGSYRFRLTVKDNHGGEVYDEVTITVKSGSNGKPTVNAGSDKQLTLPDNHVVLQGKASDPDKDQLTYFWKQQQGGGVTMKGAHTATLDVSDLKEGTYRFRLTVKDSRGAQQYDEATIVVKASSNHAPVASAGSDKKVTLPDDRVILWGSGSDRDGDPLTYYWKQQQGAGVIMKGAHTSRLDVDGLKEGTYRFRLTVKDNHGHSHYDEATINVKKTSSTARVTNVETTTSSSEAEAATASASDPVEAVDYQTLRNTSQYPSAPPALTSPEESDWSPYTVVIYNDRGERLYSGKWNTEVYQEVITEQGLYVYAVHSGQQRIKTGKIFLQK